MEDAGFDLAKLFSLNVFGRSDDELVSTVDYLVELRSRLDGLLLSLVRELDARGVARAQGASGLAAWLRDRLRISPHAARQLVSLAAEVDATEWTRDAVAAGRVNVEQAAVVVRAVADLPVGQRAAGEAFLLEQASRFGPRELARLGERLFEVVAPGEAQARPAAMLRRAEERAYADRAVHLTEVAPGRVRLSGWLDRVGAAVLRAAIDPWSAPGATRPTFPSPDDDTDTAAPDGGPGATRPDLGGGGASGGRCGGSGGGVDGRTPAQRRADALTDVCRLALSSGQLPDNGGDRPQVVVTTRLDALREQIGAATLDDGSAVTPTAARQIACDAQIIPAVLGGAGQVLDLGRERRLFTGPLRRAVLLRDRGCAFPACDRPRQWTQIHHIRHWVDGGPTTLGNAVAVCGHHHRVLHHSDWTVTMSPRDGYPDFHPPSYVDSDRRPLRNLYHHRE